MLWWQTMKYRGLGRKRHGQFEVQSWNLPGGIWGTPELYLNHERRCLCRDSNPNTSGIRAYILTAKCTCSVYEMLNRAPLKPSNKYPRRKAVRRIEMLQVVCSKKTAVGHTVWRTGRVSNCIPTWLHRNVTYWKGKHVEDNFRYKE
jgi:hypothetical protein